MTPNKPDAPERIARYILDDLDRQDTETLREIATYAENPAARKETEAETEPEEDEDIVREDSTEDNSLPDDTPKKAGVVVKTVNSNQYYCYQWREGDQAKSKYRGPVSPSE